MRRRIGMPTAAVFGLSLLVSACLAGFVRADEKAAERKKKPRFPAPAAAAGIPLIPEAWKDIPAKPLTSAELDAVLAEEQQTDQVVLASPATDEQFIRRAYLDVKGKLPPVGEVNAFVAFEGPDKRARLIDQLLASDDFARYQAQYWRDVIQSRATERQTFLAYPRVISLEFWLYDQIRANRSWADIARGLLTSEGEYQVAEPTLGGQLGLLMCHTSDTEIERANDTARVFLGINIQCAQCHDAPEHVWNRQQFHELAAYFARLSYSVDVNAKNNYNFITKLVAKPKGEYLTPDAYDATVKTATNPRFFLTGQAPPVGASDAVRRQHLADCVTAGENYYFAAAMANRVWGRLLGQAFSQYVEDLGPIQKVTYPRVLLRLAASFRASNYDMRALYRTIMNSQAYQRGFTMPEAPGQHLHFAAACPAPLGADVLWNALTSILGPVNGDLYMGRKSALPLVPHLSLRDVFTQTFGFDPSLDGREVEVTASQALLLMNNQALNANIKATGDTQLANILKEVADDRAAVSSLYQRALGRRPTDRETTTCLDHIKEVNNRNKAFEDIQWALVNSTEFRTKR